MISAAESKKPSMRRGSKLWVLACTLIGSISFVASQTYHWDERLFFGLKSQLSISAWQGKSIWLPDYAAFIDAKPVKGIEQNLSSVAYDYDQDRLLAVINSGPTELVVLSKAGEVTGRYPLVGFRDIEGIAYMGEGRVVIVDERLQQLNFFQLPTTPQSIHIEDVQFLSLGINLNGNKGFEGVTYDAENDRLYVVKERNPKQLYEISGIGSSLGKRMNITIRDLTSWIDGKVFATDLSDIYYDPKTKHLMLLSDESKLLVEMTAEGELVSFRNLIGWLSGLKQSVPQPEGVTLDKDGNLYIVSEPNLFYAFRKN